VVAGGSSWANAGADKRSAAAARVKKIFFGHCEKSFWVVVVCLFVCFLQS